jgi:hypothetical protein
VLLRAYTAAVFGGLLLGLSVVLVGGEGDRVLGRLLYYMVGGHFGNWGAAMVQAQHKNGW